MAKFIHCRVADTNPSFDVPLTLYRNVLAARPVGHLDRPSTLIHMAAVHLARFEKRRDEVDAAHAEALLQEVMDLSSAESYENQAATFLLQLQVERDVSVVQEDGQSSVVPDSTPGVAVEDLGTASVQLLERFERFGDLSDLQQAISLLEQAVRSTSVWDHRHPIGLTNLGAALAHRFERLGELSDLEQAISKHRDATGLTPHGHPDIPIRLCHLGGTLVLDRKSVV